MTTRPGHRVLVPALLLTLALCVPALSATGRAGAPDGTFGHGGLLYSHAILHGIGEDGTALESLRLLGDGSMVVGAVERGGMAQRDGVLARYTAAGRFVAKIGFPVSGEVGESKPFRIGGPLIAPDGGFVLGYSGAGASEPLLTVTNPVGDVRRVSLPVEVSPQSVLPDAGVVGLAGRSVVRLGPDLSIDATFGSGGSAAIPSSLRSLGPAAATRSAVRVAGHDGRGVLLARYGARGQLLRVSRASAGPTTSNSVHAIAQIAVRGDGRALVVARSWGTLPGGRPALQTVVVAFRPDGRVDGGFGRRGVLRLPESDDRIALQRNGRIVVVGSVSATPVSRGGARLVVRRLRANGGSDPSLPVRRLTVRPGYLEGLDVAIDRRGRIVIAAGAFTTYGKGGVMLARLLGR